MACKSSAITVKEAELFTAVIAHKTAVQSKKRSQVDVRLGTSSSLMASATTSVVAKRSKGPDPVFGAASGLRNNHFLSCLSNKTMISLPYLRVR